MKSLDFLEIMSEVDEELLARCDKERRPAIKRFLRPLSAVAAMLAVAVIGVGISVSIGRGGAEAGGYGGSANHENWALYVGPVMPLTSLDDPAGIEVQRDIHYDFSPYIACGDSYHTASQITDTYTLHNTTDQERTLTLAYPYSGRLLDAANKLPQITVNGKTIDISYYPGAHCGSYCGTHRGDGGSYNLADPTSFADYAALLTENHYAASAFDAFPVLNQSVTVYRITDPQNLGNAMSLAMEFTVDSKKTTVMTYGFSGSIYDPETGFTSRHFTIPVEGSYYDGLFQAYYVILLGEDIDNYRLQGYLNGGCQSGEEAEATAHVTRYETTLNELLLQLIAEERQNIKKTWAEDPKSEIFIADIALSNEQYLGLVAELLITNGMLAENVAERYHWGNLNDIFRDHLAHQRILYLTFEVTVPAGESITLESSMLREPHRDPEGQGKSGDGYDMATTLGSNLNFTEQSASVSNTESIEIINQNFGFDLAAGVTKVALDLNIEHYWMEVRRIPTAKE